MKTLQILLLIAAFAVVASAQRAGTVTPVSDGMRIQLTPRGLSSARTTSGSRAIANKTMDAVQNYRRQSMNVNRNSLARQIQAHAWAYLVPGLVRRRANPVNVTWKEIRPRR